MTTDPISYSLTKTYSSHYTILILDKKLFKPLPKTITSILTLLGVDILILNKDLFQPLKFSLWTPGGSQYFNP